MSDLRAKFAAAGDRETVDVPNVGTVEVRTCRVGDRFEVLRLSSTAAQTEDPVAKMLAATKAQSYLIAVTVRDPATGELIFDATKPEDVERGMDADAFELLGQVAMRVSGLDELAQKAAKNASGANGESSTVSPENSIAPSRSSGDGSQASSMPSA